MGSCCSKPIRDESQPLLSGQPASKEDTNEPKDRQADVEPAPAAPLKVEVNNEKKEEIAKESPEMKDAEENVLKVLTWNIAGINNNPFEYYVSLKDKNYNELMSEIELFLTETGKEVKVRSLLDSIDDKFFDKLEQLLGEKCDNFKKLITNDVDEYLDLSIPDFLSNKSIGEHRLISWPDRLLNTIDDKEENNAYLYRPTVINYYGQTFKDSADWFVLWCDFMRDRGLKILEQNVDNKYAKKFGRDNNEIFMFLNVIFLALFDAILIFMMFDIESKKGIKWQQIKANLYGILNENKMNKTVQIINEQYYGFDVLMLQEVRNNLLSEVEKNENLKKFAANYHILFPEKVSKNNQTSIICLNKSKWPNPKIEDVTADFYAAYNGKMGINDGDLIVLFVESKFLLVSFHGDTGGMASGDLLKCIKEIHESKYADSKLIAGFDANTYFDGIADGKKKYSVNVFNELIKELKMNTCFDGELPTRHTTNCPRTYLQPQLNKAVKKVDIVKDEVDFRSPKDFILFDQDCFDVVGGQTVIDNIGNKSYDDNVEYVMPSQDFPSDHAIVSSHLKMK